MPIGIWGWLTTQKLAGDYRASSPVYLVHGVSWASLGPRPNSKHFLSLSLSHWDHQWKLFPSDWDLNSCAGNQTQLKHRLGLELMWPKMLFEWESLTWCLDLLRLMFFVSDQRKNLVRDRVIGKKLILFREKHTPQSVGHDRRWVWPWNVVWLAFMGWIIS